MCHALPARLSSALDHEVWYRGISMWSCEPSRSYPVLRASHTRTGGTSRGRSLQWTWTRSLRSSISRISPPDGVDRVSDTLACGAATRGGGCAANDSENCGASPRLQEETDCWCVLSPTPLSKRMGAYKDASGMNGHGRLLWCLSTVLDRGAIVSHCGGKWSDPPLASSGGPHAVATRQ